MGGVRTTESAAAGAASIVVRARARMLTLVVHDHERTDFIEDSLRTTSRATDRVIGRAWSIGCGIQANPIAYHHGAVDTMGNRLDGRMEPVISRGIGGLDRGRVPDCLHFHEGFDPGDALSRCPAGVLAEADALEVFGGAGAEGGGVLEGVAGGVDSVDVPVRGDVGDEFAVIGGENIYNAGWDVAGGAGLGEVGGDGGGDLTREDDGGVARTEDWGEKGDEREERRRVGAEDGDDTGGIGDGEVVMGASDGVLAAEDLGVLVGPAGVVDEAVDGGGDLVGGREARGARFGLCGFRRGLGGLLVEGEFVLELVGAGLEHLGEAVEDLAPVVRGGGGPLGLGGAGVLDGVAQVFAGGEGDVGDEGAIGSVGWGGAA